MANKFTPCSITVAPILPAYLPLQPRKAGFEVKSGLKILLCFVATHEVVFAVVALFGCLNFTRNVVFHRPYLKELFKELKSETLCGRARLFKREEERLR